MAGTLGPAVAQGVSPCTEGTMGAGTARASSRAMDETNEPLLHDLDLPPDAEIELMDWARAAGVSADELRRALLGANN